ncbi:MAG: tetratricopeptide repeat protein [Prolixibacteraceae bacterium]|jgi:tetratricopeptide (TPR) repeat protein
MKRSFLILFLFFFQIISAQNQLKIDSLQIKLDNSSEDTVKIKLLLALSDSYYRVDLVKSLLQAKNALELSEDIKNDLFVVRSRMKIGSSLIFMGNYDEALSNFLSSLTIAKKNKYRSEELIALTYIGIIQDRIGQFDEALRYYFEALNLYNNSIETGQTLKDVKNIQSLYNNIGNIYLSKNNLSTAEEYYLKGLALSEKSNDDLNIGTICNNMGKLEMQRNNNAKALEFLCKSLEAREKINDKSGIAKSYYHLSSYYQNINQFDKALSFAQDALKLSQEVKEPLSSQISAMFLYQITKYMTKIYKYLYHLERKRLKVPKQYKSVHI